MNLLALQVALALVAVPAVPPDEAGAARPLTASFELWGPELPTDGVPVEGVLVLPLQWVDFSSSASSADVDGLAASYVAVTVRPTAAEGAGGEPASPIEGTLDWRPAESRLVWRSLSPLAPASAYEVHFVARNAALAADLGMMPPWTDDPERTYTVTTAAGPTPAPVAPTLLGFEATDTLLFGTACCEATPGLCRDGCTGCGPAPLTVPQAHLRMDLGVTGAATHYVSLKAYLEGPAGYRLTEFGASVDAAGGHVTAVMDVPLETYCVVTEAHHLVSDVTTTGRVCLDAAELPPHRPDPSAVGQHCPVDTKATAGADSGCSGGPAPDPVGLAALLGLLLWRRRDRRLPRVTRASLLTLAVLAAGPARAFPVMPPEPPPVPSHFWEVVFPSARTPFTIPADGALSFDAAFVELAPTFPVRTAEEGLAFVRIEVGRLVDGGEQHVPGTMRWDEDLQLLIWTPLEPLTAGLQHAVTVEVDNEGLAMAWDERPMAQNQTWSSGFAVTEPDAGPGEPLALELTSLAHWIRAESVCCGTGEVLCVEGVCEPCQLARTALPDARLGFTGRSAGSGMPQVRYRAWLEGPGGYELSQLPVTVDGSGSGAVVATVDLALERYCVHLEARHLAAATTEEDVVCFDHADVPIPDADRPEHVVTASMCRPEPDDGCSAAAPGRGPLAALLAALLLTLRRRAVRGPA